MHVLSKHHIKLFTAKHNGSEETLITWFKLMEKANDIHTADDIKKKMFNHLDVLANGLHVFNVGGNKYRVIAKINYHTSTLYITQICTHKEYDSLDLKKGLDYNGKY